MRKGWLALPLLVCATACSPVKGYQEAARSLRFHLDRVEPDLRVALPLDRSRILFRVTLGVDNPSQIPFHIQGFGGDLRLEFRGDSRPIGRLELVRPLELPALGSTRLEAELSFSYQELRENWVAIQAVARGGPATWRLEGTLRGQAYGLAIQVPVHTSRTSGDLR